MTIWGDELISAGEYFVSDEQGFVDFTATREQEREDMSDQLKSSCCDATISASLADGVLVGSCSKCQSNLMRLNPQTGQTEWLDGAPPWTNRSLRRIDEMLIDWSRWRP